MSAVNEFILPDSKQYRKIVLMHVFKKYRTCFLTNERRHQCPIVRIAVFYSSVNITISRILNLNLKLC